MQINQITSRALLHLVVVLSMTWETAYAQDACALQPEHSCGNYKYNVCAKKLVNLRASGSKKTKCVELTKLGYAGPGDVYSPKSGSYFEIKSCGECPTPSPTPAPTPMPSPAPTPTPTPAPTPAPTPPPTPSPTPTPTPTPSPTPAPTQAPTPAPTPAHTPAPTSMSSFVPSRLPTSAPSAKPTSQPSFRPSSVPSKSMSPSSMPSKSPSEQPSDSAHPTFSCGPALEEIAEAPIVDIRTPASFNGIDDPYNWHGYSSNITLDSYTMHMRFRLTQERDNQESTMIHFSNRDGFVHTLDIHHDGKEDDSFQFYDPSFCLFDCARFDLRTNCWVDLKITRAIGGEMKFSINDGIHSIQSSVYDDSENHRYTLEYETRFFDYHEAFSGRDYDTNGEIEFIKIYEGVVEDLTAVVVI